MIASEHSHLVPVPSQKRRPSVSARDCQNPLQKAFDCIIDQLRCRQRWLAYAIFYSRSKKLAAENTSRRIEMGENYFDSVCCDALIKTLSVPARELVYQGLQDGGAPEDELLLLAIKQGTKFYTDSQVTQERVCQLEHEKLVEALCEREDWACVLLPGVGIGWVASDQIVSVERETVDRSSVSVELGFEGLFAYEQKSDEALPSFFEHVGCYLSYLRLKESWVGTRRRQTNKLATVLRHYVNLKHLRLCDSDIVDVLNGDLGDRLASLDLNDNDIDSAGFGRLSAFLANRVRVPALPELRISNTTTG